MPLLHASNPILALAGTAGFEPATYNGVKVRCLEPLDDIPRKLSRPGPQCLVISLMRVGLGLVRQTRSQT